MTILSVLVLLVRMGFIEKLSMSTVSPGVGIPEKLLGTKGHRWEEPTSMKFPEYKLHFSTTKNPIAFTF